MLHNVLNVSHQYTCLNSDDMDAIQDENFSADYSPLTFPPEITEVVASSGILQSVLAKANLPEDKVMTVLASASKPSHKVQPLLHFHSLIFCGRDQGFAIYV